MCDEHEGEGRRFQPGVCRLMWAAAGIDREHPLPAGVGLGDTQ